MQKSRHVLENHLDAAQKLIDVMPMARVKEEEWVFVAVSKNGLDLASKIRKKLKNPLEILFSEGIVAPHNSECEVARVSETEEIVVHEKLIASFEIKYDYIYGEAHRNHEEDILRYIYQYRKGKPFPSMRDKVVLLVDNGTETGAKFLTGIKTILAMKPKAIYIAVPVIPKDVLELLEPSADDIYYIYSIDDFVTTSLYYKELESISEEQIEILLEDR